MDGMEHCKKILDKYNFKHPESLTGTEISIALQLKVVEQNEEIIMLLKTINTNITKPESTKRDRLT